MHADLVGMVRDTKDVTTPIEWMYGDDVITRPRQSLFEILIALTSIAIKSSVTIVTVRGPRSDMITHLQTLLMSSRPHYP